MADDTAATEVEATPEDAAAAAPEPELVHGCPVAESHGQRVVFADRDRYPALMTALRDEGFNVCADITAVDYLTHPERSLPEGVEVERFEVVVNLLDMEGQRRIRVRCQVPAADPTLPTLFDLWPGADAPEREVYDMLGIAFEGHPDLSRILMPDDWEGHPLRKDYAMGRIPVQFKEAPGPR
jgi:NADH-quinone oxidoreductase subunit C